MYHCSQIHYRSCFHEPEFLILITARYHFSKKRLSFAFLYSPFCLGGNRFCVPILYDCYHDRCLSIPVNTIGIAVTILVSAKYSATSICNDCGWDGDRR